MYPTLNTTLARKRTPAPQIRVFCRVRPHPQSAVRCPPGGTALTLAADGREHNFSFDKVGGPGPVLGSALPPPCFWPPVACEDLSLSSGSRLGWVLVGHCRGLGWASTRPPTGPPPLAGVWPVHRPGRHLQRGVGAGAVRPGRLRGLPFLLRPDGGGQDVHHAGGRQQGCLRARGTAPPAALLPNLRPTASTAQMLRRRNLKTLRKRRHFPGAPRAAPPPKTLKPPPPARAPPRARPTPLARASSPARWS